MKRALFARALVLTAALAIALTPGCRRKPGGITPIPGRMGGQIEDPSPGGPAPLFELGPTGVLGSDGGVVGSDVHSDGRSEFQPDTNIALGSDPLPRDQYSEDRGQFANNVVLFDFDSAVVKESERGKVTGVADYLRSNPRAAVEVEGHCDERGTEEYNRSLGERRALAIREELALQGIDPRRVYTISYGEDRPAVDGHDEYAYSRNRRGEFVLLNPK
jgi:peptidoglycan-associated lipoprotein